MPTTLADNAEYTVVRNDDGSVTLTNKAGSPGANLATLQAQAVQAIADNITYIAIASPSNAQVAAQVKALTRQVDAIIRVVLGQVSSTTGT